MKTIITGTILILMCTVSVYAQDIIVTKNGEQIKAKVEEITVTDVKYKKSNNLSGPTYTIPKSDIIHIAYADGSTDVFNQKAAVTSSNSTSSDVTSSSGASSQVPPRVRKDPAVRFGLKAGLNIANIKSKDYIYFWEDDEVSPRFGFTGGVLLDFNLHKYFSIQPEFLISMKGCYRERYTTIVNANNLDEIMYEDAFKEWHINLTYFELPVNFLFKIPTGNGKIFLGAGPYLAYGIAGKSKSHFTYEERDIDDELIDSDLESKLFSGEQKMFKPLDLGVNVLAGYEFGSGFFINAGYNTGLASIADAEEDVSVKNNSIHFSVGIKF